MGKVDELMEREFKVYEGDGRPTELSDDDWVEIWCHSGAVNTCQAKDVLWDRDPGPLPYWAVIAWRRNPTSSAAR